MKRAFVLLSLAVLAGCATTTAPPPSIAEPMFHDELFAAPTEPVDAGGIFALSEPMRRYLAEDIATQLRTLGPQAGLLDALYRRGQLKLEYDGSVTRTAAEAFAARTGNCLSLVVMTAALAKELNLTVRYQSAYLEEAWSRNGTLLLHSSHVNLTLGPRKGDELSRFGNSLTIDFLPPEDLRGLRTVELHERTIVAMFMNNRAVEAMLQGRADDAYAWAKEAIRRDPDFLSSYNTLGTLYLRHGALHYAAPVFRYALARKPDNTRTLANLASTMELMGDTAEAERLRRRLALLEEAPPFHHFKLGLAAMRRDDFAAARDLFAKEVERAEYNAEFQYWLGVASLKLGDLAPAARHLALAREYSTTRGEREQYAAKLAALKANARH